MTASRWLDRSPSARLHRAAHTLFGDLPEPVRWLVAWVALIGAMLVATLAVADVLTLTLR